MRAVTGTGNDAVRRDFLQSVFAGIMPSIASGLKANLPDLAGAASVSLGGWPPCRPGPYRPGYAAKAARI